MSEVDPYEESGPVTMCANCYDDAIWISGKGWIHRKTGKKICEK